MSAPQRRRTEAAKPAARRSKAETKRLLLARAKHLFLTLGYPATTTAQIAEAAGVTEPTLLRHFDGKKALFLEVVREIRQATLGRWDAESAAPADPVAKLHLLADAYLATTSQLDAEFRVLHRALVECADEDIRSPLRALYLEIETLLARVIAEGQQTGVFRRSLEPRVGAWEMIRTALGYTLTLPLGVPLYDEPDYVPRAIECLLHCLLKTDV